MAKITCPYCNELAELATGFDLFPQLPDLAQKSFWRCEPCHAHVGCHNGSTRPLGTLANRQLRNTRMQVHQALDPLWKAAEPKFESRSAVYAWLATELGVSKNDCHVARFDEMRCQQAIEKIRERHAR